MFISRNLLTQTSYLQDTTQKGALNDPSADILDQRSRSHSLVKCPKISQNLKNGSHVGCNFTYRLHTWYQGTTYYGAFNDISADDLDQRSRSNGKVKSPQKWVKNKTNGHISDDISPTVFILVTKIQLNKAHSMTQVPMHDDLDRSQNSQKWVKKLKNWPYHRWQCSL